MNSCSTKSKKSSTKQDKTYTEKLGKAKEYLRSRNKYAIETNNTFVYKDSSGRTITKDEIERVKSEVLPLRKVI